MQMLSTYFCRGRSHLHTLCRTPPALTSGFLPLPLPLLCIYCSDELINVARCLNLVSLALTHCIAMMTYLCWFFLSAEIVFYDECNGKCWSWTAIVVCRAKVHQSGGRKCVTSTAASLLLLLHLKQCCSARAGMFFCPLLDYWCEAGVGCNIVQKLWMTTVVYYLL